MTYIGIYVLIAVLVAIYCGVDTAIRQRGKLDLDDLVLPVVIGICWPGVVAALGFFGIGFLFKLLCEQIARLIIGIRKPNDSKIGLENIAKEP